MSSGLTSTLSTALDRGRGCRLLRRVLPAPRTGADPCATVALSVRREDRPEHAAEGATEGGRAPDRLRVSGELDVWTAPLLSSELGRLVGGRPGRVVLDLEDLCFCDVAGLRALLEVADRVADRGGAVRLLHPCWSLDLLVRRSGRDALLAG